MSKIQLHDVAKIEEAVERSAPSTLVNVFYNAEKKRLEATDGFILAIHSQTGNGGSLPDHDCLIGLGAIAEARESDNWAELGATPARRLKASEVLRQFPELEKEPLMVIDVDLLARLARAICHDGQHRMVAVFERKAAKPCEPLLVIPLTCDPGVPCPFGVIAQVHTSKHHAFDDTFDALKDEEWG